MATVTNDLNTRDDFAREGSPQGGVDSRSNYERRIDAERRVDPDRRSVVDLLKELRDESTALIRQEVALAKTELSEKASRVGRNTGYLVVGGAVAYAGLLVLLFGLAAAVYAGLVALEMSHMAAGVISILAVGGITLAIGAILAKKAISTLKHESVVPERTADSLKENTQWAQHKITNATA